GPLSKRIRSSGTKTSANSGGPPGAGRIRWSSNRARVFSAGRAPIAGYGFRFRLLLHQGRGLGLVLLHARPLLPGQFPPWLSAGGPAREVRPLLLARCRRRPLAALQAEEPVMTRHLAPAHSARFP